MVPDDENKQPSFTVPAARTGEIRAGAANPTAAAPDDWIKTRREILLMETPLKKLHHCLTGVGNRKVCFIFNALCS